MTEENQEIVAAILAAGAVMAKGPSGVGSNPIDHAKRAVDVYHHCLTELQWPNQEDRPS